jgi:hypothetical protein
VSVSGQFLLTLDTWRWQCDTLATGTPEDQQYRPTPVSLLARDAATDQELAA